MEEEKQETTLNKEKMAAVLDVRHLVQRCLELEKELRSLLARNHDQEKIAADFERECERLKPFAQIALEDLDKKKQEILTRLRSIVHTTGEFERLREMESLLGDENVSPQEVERWHRTVEKEFHSMYPTSPRSVTREEKSGQEMDGDWSAFRVRTA